MLPIYRHGVSQLGQGWLPWRCGESGFYVFYVRKLQMSNSYFGRYIEDILISMKDGDKEYKSMLSCYYVENIDEVKECA